jgi:hypothetical protein
MLTRFKCCCWLAAACLCRFALGDQEPVKNSTPRPTRCELFFFSFYPALDPWALLRWTARETVKDLPRSVTRRPPEFSVILSRAAWGFRPGQQVVVPVVPVPVHRRLMWNPESSGNSWGLGPPKCQSPRTRVLGRSQRPGFRRVQGRGRGSTGLVALESQGG